MVEGSHRPASLDAQEAKKQKLDAREATYRKAKEFEQLATSDALTGLSNRREFEKRASDIIEGMRIGGRASDPEKQIGIMMCDIDHFKVLNDTQGHTAGDKALQKVASTLRTNLRPQDLVGRWGGEEFAICIIDGDKDQIVRIAESLRKDIEELGIAIENTSLTMSFGVTLVNEEDTFESAIKRADDALMHSSKAKGRNRVEFL